jgi:hypothetical protein
LHVRVDGLPEELYASLAQLADKYITHLYTLQTHRMHAIKGVLLAASAAGGQLTHHTCLNLYTLHTTHTLHNTIKGVLLAAGAVGRRLAAGGRDLQSRDSGQRAERGGAGGEHGRKGWRFACFLACLCLCVLSLCVSTWDNSWW